MQGYNVLHPIGWDAFGLPAEQYALQTGTHPRVTTERNIARFRQQLQALGAPAWRSRPNERVSRRVGWPVCSVARFRRLRGCAGQAGHAAGRVQHGSMADRVHWSACVWHLNGAVFGEGGI